MIQLLLLVGGVLLLFFALVSNARANHHDEKGEDLGDEYAEAILAGQPRNILANYEAPIDRHRDAVTLWRILAGLFFLLGILLIVLSVGATLIP